MASYESARTAAYSEDLRWRMVYQRKALEYSVRRVAENLGVSPATVSRTLEVFDRTGTVSNQEYPEDHNRAKKLTQTDEFLILQLVTDSPGIYLGEIQTELACSTGTFVDTSTICRFLYKSGFTRKKLQSVALQRSEELRQTFMQEMTIYNRDMFAFVDEMGSDRRDSLRKFGYRKACKTTEIISERQVGFCYWSALHLWDAGLPHS